MNFGICKFVPTDLDSKQSLKKISPGIILIFGASGDLAKRKLIPALFALYQQKLLPEKFKIVGFARSKMTREQFIDKIKEPSCYEGEESCQPFFSHFEYFSGNYTDPEDFFKLSYFIHSLEKEQELPPNHLYYLSTPPAIVKNIIINLAESGLIEKNKYKESNFFNRIVIEKPFGSDYQSAYQLNNFLHQFINEKNIYRIDHYLGKETVQNILMCRFSNILFEPLFNNKYVSHIQITVSESLGIGSRAGYFDQTGVLKDMIQNHLFQLLALITMEPPTSFSSHEIHDEKVKIFSAIRPYQESDIFDSTVRGQYQKGTINNDQVPAFLKEEGINPHSTTETYAAIQLLIDNWRWAEVPFFLRTGKRLKTKNTEIAVYFKQLPCSLFQKTNIRNIYPNSLIFRIQPEEGISLMINAKTPGYDMILENVKMDFPYGEAFGDTKLSDAYERLIYDALIGDSTLFAREDEIEKCWKITDTITHAWNNDPKSNPLHLYPAGSQGPEKSDELIEQFGFKWRPI